MGGPCVFRFVHAQRGEIINVDAPWNWEQGRNRPDAAALALVMAYDKAPDVVADAALEQVA